MQIEKRIDDWNRRSKLKIDELSLDKLDNWICDHKSIRHKSGSFFAIKGARIVDKDNKVEWDQPFIDQPEIGLLGLFAVKTDSTIKFAIQMKVEPGNKGPTQLSPTVQATRSNQRGLHGGKKVKYIELFYEKIKGINVVADALQTEQGVRFYRKKNRNIIRIGEKIPDCMKDDKSLVWLTLEEA